MKRALLFLTAAALLSVHVPMHGQTLPLKHFRDYVESLRVQAGIPGLAVAIVGHEGVFLEQAFGRQDVARSIAARTDTPFHADGLTQMFTAALALRCAEEGRLSLDDRIGRLKPDASDPNATIRDILMHTSPSPGGPVFAHRPERYEWLAHPIRACTTNSYRESLATMLDQLAMRDSVPGPDILRLVPPAEGIPDAAEVDRYARILDRMATAYFVDLQRTSQTPLGATTLTPATGLITSVLDLAQFDRALRGAVLLQAGTLAQAWTPLTGSDGKPLPHGLGWFSQVYNGERIVWQFGGGTAGSSSLFVALPARGITFILMANSGGLFKTPPLTVNDLIASPFVRLFLGFSAA